MKGVSSFTEKEVDLYEDLVYPDEKVLSEISDDLVESLLKSDRLSNKNTWKIFEPGVGGGWITSRVLEKALSSRWGPRKIEYIGVDPAGAMLEKFRENLCEQFGVESLETDQGAEIPRLGLNLHNKSFPDEIWGSISDDRFDVIFASFIIHHLKDWREGLGKLIQITEDGGVFVCSEMRGDHAAWSYSFDKVYDVEELESNKERRNWLRFSKRFMDTLEKSNFYNRNRIISASEVSPIIERLENSGFFILGSLDNKFSKEFTISEWLATGGYIEDDELPEERVFSVFPKEGDNIGINDISNLTEDTFGKKYSKAKDINLKTKDCIELHVLEKKSKNKYQTKPIEKSARENAIEIFSNLHDINKKDTEKLKMRWKRDMTSLISFEMVKKPILIFMLRWDILEEEWFRDVPIFSNIQGFKGLVEYSWLVENILERNFRMTNVIYRDLPDKSIFSWRFTEDETKPYNISMRKNGSIKKIRINIPKNVQSKIRGLNLDYYISNEKVLDISEKISGIRSDIRYFNYKDVDNFYDNLEESKSQILSKYREVTSEIEYPIDEELKRCFWTISSIRDNELWKIEEEDRKSLAEAILISGIIGADGLVHHPSRDTLVNKNGATCEIATGGLVIYKKSDTHVDEQVLSQALNLRNRASSIDQHRKKAARDARKKAVQSSIASIMSRNMDHLLGSHIETALSHQMPHLRESVHRIALDEELPLLPPHRCTESCYADGFWQDRKLRSNSNDKKTRAKIDKMVHDLKATYSSYRLKRMDLIARVSTEWIPWGADMSFFHQVMLPFIKNGVLLHFLGHGENIHLRDIHFDISYPDRDMYSSVENIPTVKMYNNYMQNGGKKNFYKLSLASLPEFEPYFRTPPISDFMRIRGGGVGAHAFHIIFENVLRNSAKHGGQLGGSPKIELKTLAIRENPESIIDELNFDVRNDRKKSLQKAVREDGDRYWFILISSSADCDYDEESPKSIAADIDKLICKPLVRETGETDPEAWGIKEKKICAAYLAELGTAEVDAKDPQYLWSGVLPWRDDGKKRLAYCLKIPKSRFLLYAKSVSSQ